MADSSRPHTVRGISAPGGCGAAPARVVFRRYERRPSVEECRLVESTTQWSDFVTGFQSGCTARIGRPTGIAVGSKGSLFIADDLTRFNISRSPTRLAETLGVLVGGGPAPGINGVIASAAMEAVKNGLRAARTLRRLPSSRRRATPQIARVDRRSRVAPPRDRGIDLADVADQPGPGRGDARPLHRVA